MAHERGDVALVGADVGDLVGGADVVDLDLARVDRINDEAEVDADVARACREVGVRLYSGADGSSVLTNHVGHCNLDPRGRAARGARPPRPPLVRSIDTLGSLG